MAITEENSKSSQQPKAENVKIIIDDQIQSMKMNLSQYKVKDQKPAVGCKYTVPDNLRVEDEDKYSPKVVSIGPIHHHRRKLQLLAVEQSKWMFLDWYLERRIVSLDDMVQAAIDIEEEARMSYLERFDNISSQEFSEMIILDFIFLIEFFFKIDIGDQQPFDDSVYIDILSDMMLLENQLPQRLVTSLFDKLYKEDDTLGKLILKHFSNYSIAEFPEARPDDWNSATDMLDFMVKCNGDKIKSTFNAKTKLTWLERTCSAIKLREAGVKFSKLDKADSLLDVKFVNGVLEMPIIKLDSFSEILFRNMIACEQTRRDNPKRVSGYIILLSHLIKSPKDVALLSDCGIIQHPYHNVDEVIGLFETVATEVAYDPKKCYFWGLYVKMLAYSSKNWHQWKGSWFKWKRMLRENYFSSPWSIISFIAAFILLVLTVLQTIYAIK